MAEPTTTVRRRRRDWGPMFLEILGKTGVVLYAAQAAGIDRDAAYKRRRRDPAFAAAWDRAIDDSQDRLVAEARRRAMAGSERLLIYSIELNRRRVVDRPVSRADVWRRARRLAEAAGLDPAELMEMAERLVEVDVEDEDT